MQGDKDFATWLENITVMAKKVRKVEKPRYHKQVVEEYKSNPLIEALPPILSMDKAYDLLAVYPKYKKEEIEAPSEIRLQYVQRLKTYFQPLDKHIDLFHRFGAAIRQGYVTRNPITSDYNRRLQKWYQDLMSGKTTQLEDDESLPSSGLGFTMIGISGIGKSTAIKRVLSSYPQVIEHAKYKNQPFVRTQLVWLKLDCPPSGSLRALCLGFFKACDEILGTTYFKQYGTSKRLSAASMVPLMGPVAASHSLGVLIIDEIQHLSQAASGGAEEMLNFFVTMVNTIGIPVILIGTPKALPILQHEFCQARRGSGQGDMVWDRMKNDQKWKILINGMWEYQWTKNNVPLTQEMIDVFYEESQGIVDIAVKLFMLAQFKLIAANKKELLTPEVIRSVAKNNLRLVRPMLDALKSGITDRIMIYQDIALLNIDEQYKMASEELKQVQSAPIDQQALLQLTEMKLFCNQIILKLMELDVDRGQAKLAAEQVIAAYGDSVNLEKAIDEAYKIVLTSNITKDNTKNKVINKAKKKQYLESDLRYYHRKAIDNKCSVYDVLSDAGYIKNARLEFYLEGV
ncbi:hypothetical protein SPFL3102_02875 [Sporomusaceae bacterium FL31]|nr:hypothetical protein SPFL3101_01205 [Sporomusaceae bacterium FL31]GCE35047.1 hypothetical protein SPFL3102_02875 [Sporomusaceae bacterium]